MISQPAAWKSELLYVFFIQFNSWISSVWITASNSYPNQHKSCFLLRDCTRCSRPCESIQNHPFLFVKENDCTELSFETFWVCPHSCIPNWKSPSTLLPAWPATSELWRKAAITKPNKSHLLDMYIYTYTCKMILYTFTQVQLLIECKNV